MSQVSIVIIISEEQARVILASERKKTTEMVYLQTGARIRLANGVRFLEGTDRQVLVYQKMIEAMS